MRLRLRDIPLGQKLTGISIISSAVALVLALAAFVSYELVSFKNELIAEVSGAAAIIGHNSAAALAFNDTGSAEQTLQSLSTQERVVGAALYDRDGRVFATYGADPLEEPFEAPAVEESGYRFDGNRLKLFQTFELAGELGGTVYIESSVESVGELLVSYGLLGLLVMLASSGAALLLSAKMQRGISRSIADLSAAMSAVRVEHNYHVRAAKQSDDELGKLIGGFNAMLDQIEAQDDALQEARDNLERRVELRTRELQQEVLERKAAQAELERIHSKLVAASRQAGMAEVATNILHNVGNVLNSVNVSAGLLAEHAQQSKAVDLRKLADLLTQHQDDLESFLVKDGRGKTLVNYVNRLADQLQSERELALKEATALQNRVDHIKGIVAMQQTYSKVGGVTEPTEISDLIEAAVRMSSGSLERHDIEIVRDLADVPRLVTDKHKVLQVLVNLVRNAADACKASAQAKRRVTIRVAKCDDRMKLSVSDNGVGIAPEAMARIFSHGFTTKKDGHGFGLHSGSLAARELGGELTVHSDGPGRGATFNLMLPFEPPQQASNAPALWAARAAND